jgi:cation transport ATPase
VLFDRTGTLTPGRHAMTGAAAVAGLSDADPLDPAAAVAAGLDIDEVLGRGAALHKDAEVSELQDRGRHRVAM